MKKRHALPVLLWGKVVWPRRKGGGGVKEKESKAGEKKRELGTIVLYQLCSRASHQGWGGGSIRGPDPKRRKTGQKSTCTALAGVFSVFMRGECVSEKEGRSKTVQGGGGGGDTGPHLRKIASARRIGLLCGRDGP